MAAPSVALIGGLRAFDHTVIVGDETVQTLALYKEDDASHLTYCPSGESIFGGHAVNYPSPIDRSLPYGSLSRFLATGDHIFFLPCPGSSEDEAVAAGSGSLALQSALLVANRPPRTLQDRFMDREVIPTLPDTPMDAPIPFLYEWTTLLLGRCCRTLRDAGIYHGLWASIFQYNCDVSVVRAFIDAWNIETNTLVTCQGEFSVTLLDMDRIFGLPISGHFYDEVSPTVADFTDVRSSALPYSCRRLFQAYHHLCRGSESNVISATAWVEFWFRLRRQCRPRDSEEDEDYDSDRSHPRKRRPKGRKQVVASSVKKKRAPLTVLNDASTFMKKKPRKEVPPVSFPLALRHFFLLFGDRASDFFSARAPSSRDCSDLGLPLEAPEAPPEEAAEGTETVEEPAEIAPVLTQPEALPIHEVSPSPSVVQEAAEEATIEEAAPVSVLPEVDAAPAPSIEDVVEVEAPSPVVEEEAPTSVIEAPAIEAGIEVVQEEVPIEEVFETVLAPEEVALEVVPSEPAVEGAPIVQNSAILPTSSSLTASQTPSQQLLSYVEGLMLQAWKDKIAPRMVSPGAVRDGPLLADAEFIIGRLQEVSHDVTRLRVYTQKLQVLSEMESSTREKASRISRDRAECGARESLGILSSKLEDAEITLSEVAEELSEAKDDEEDARERLELAKEQLQSAETKVVYLTTQAEQIQESVRDLKKAVVAAEQMVAEIIARPTLSATEEAALLSLRADFAEAQQEIAKDL
ncbi:hypothetical protein H6P81_006335 [Aristolochia fimbriata]|uniref:Aminotransferase-like plant mobile domain-containing protein n=1 Tax=Aristolochia fimbriata TaxID=158543 RepID=A0AAV7EZT5_ARIFI|nr:hypothetical protein H6P81_006335 [Aristolochia fimbriata]